MLKSKKILIILLIFSFSFSNQAQALSLAQRLSGRILLQVESRGEAWYLSPKNNKKYYLGRPEDAFTLMKKLSLGISEKEFATWKKGAPSWAKGGLFIRPQSHGEAYYVDVNNRWNYLGRPLDAWLLFRNKGLGISNSDLATIETASLSFVSTPVIINNSAVLPTGSSDHSTSLLWKYDEKDYNYLLPLQSSLNNSYSTSQKAFYFNDSISEQTAREKFYALFFIKKNNDSSVSNLISYANKIATNNSWTEDQKLEFLMSIIQYIPYDHSKLNDNPLQPNYPYETLYKDSGICSDKTFLAVTVLRELGYGAAILDFPTLKHSAAGVSCPVADSINGSGYCYVETTNYFPLGVIPPTISGGQAVSAADNLANLFDASRLNKIEIYQKTNGRIYQGVSATKKFVSELKIKKDWLETEKITINIKNEELKTQQADLLAKKNKLDAFQAAGDASSYNSQVGAYNSEVNTYNATLALYQVRLNTYNTTVKDYNAGLKALYQQ